MISDQMNKDSISWQTVMRAAEALHSFPNAVIVSTRKYCHTPSAGSQASNELDESMDIGSLETAYALGAQQLVFACDHALAVHRLLVTQPQLSYSPWTCARAVLEACSTSFLLLDPAIDSLERTTRSLNLRIEDIWRAQRHFGKMASMTSAVAQDLNCQYDSRVVELGQRARALGIVEKLNKKGRLLGFGHGGHSITNRIEDAFGASDDYSLLSASAHAATWAVLHLGANVESTDPPRAEPGLSPEGAMFLIMRPIEWVARGLWAYYRLFGWDLDEGKALLEAGYDQVGLKYELRFWR